MSSSQTIVTILEGGGWLFVDRQVRLKGRGFAFKMEVFAKRVVRANPLKPLSYVPAMLHVLNV